MTDTRAPAVTLATLLERSYRHHAGEVAVVDGDRRMTYAQLGDRAHRVANALAELGVRRGDALVIVAGNRRELIGVDHGLWVGGFVRVALSNRLHPNEVAHIVGDCGAAAVVVEPEWADQLQGSTRVVVLGEPYEDLVTGSSAEPPGVLPGAGDLAALLYTSGTTGMPKGAMLTHANWVAMARNSMVELPPIDRSDVVLHVAPLSHLSGYAAIPYFVGGATHVVLRRFEPPEVLETIGAERVTAVPLVPTMINLLLPTAEAGHRDTSSLRTILYAGSAIAPDRLARAVRAFGEVLVQFYGLSETPMPLTTLSARDHRFDPDGCPPPRLASAGRVNPFVELRLLSDDAGEVPTGDVGEIAVRGDTVMAGYWGKPAETAEMIDDEGWARTGDLGRLDDDGYLYIVDRKKDMIVTGGYNVYPTEVENAISTLAEVEEVAVVGVPDERWGESIKAVVVRRPGAALSEEDVVEACTKALAGYKKPRSVEFVDQLPKTGSGKIMRRKVRDAYWEASGRQIG